MEVIFDVYGKTPTANLSTFLPGQAHPILSVSTGQSAETQSEAIPPIPFPSSVHSPPTYSRGHRGQNTEKYSVNGQMFYKSFIQDLCKAFSTGGVGRSKSSQAFAFLDRGRQERQTEISPERIYLTQAVWCASYSRFYLSTHPNKELLLPG